MNSTSVNGVLDGVLNLVSKRLSKISMNAAQICDDRGYYSGGSMNAKSHLTTFK